MIDKSSNPLPMPTQVTKVRFWSGWFAVIAGTLLVIDLAREVILFADGPAQFSHDTEQYWLSGTVIAQGDWLQISRPTPYRTPLYAIFLGLIQKLFGSSALLATCVLQHLAVLATTWSTALGGARLARNRWAFVVCLGLNLAFTTRIWYANAVLTETLFTLWWTWGMIAFLFLFDQPDRKSSRAIVVGLLWGIATLIRPVPQLLVPVLAGMLAIFGWWTAGRPGNARAFWASIKPGVVMLAVFAALLFACAARNRAIHGAWFLTQLPAANKWAVAFRSGSGGDLPWPTSSSAQELERRLGPGSWNDEEPYPVRDRLLAAGMSVEDAERLMTRISLDAITAHPRTFGWKAFQRIGNFWRCSPGHPPFGIRPADAWPGQYTWGWKPWDDWTTKLLLWSFTRDYGRNQWMSAAALTAIFILIGSPSTRWAGLCLLGTGAYFCLLTGLVEIENYRYRMVLEPTMLLGFALVFRTRPASHSE